MSVFLSLEKLLVVVLLQYSFWANNTPRHFNLGFLTFLSNVSSDTICLALCCWLIWLNLYYTLDLECGQKSTKFQPNMSAIISSEKRCIWSNSMNQVSKSAGCFIHQEMYWGLIFQWVNVGQHWSTNQIAPLAPKKWCWCLIFQRVKLCPNINKGFAFAAPPIGLIQRPNKIKRI